MRGVWIACMMLVAGQGVAGTWTNRAGHSVSGTLAGLTNGVVSVRSTNGVLRQFPLRVFRPDEQRRIELACDCPAIPDGLRAAYEFARRKVVRARLLRDQNLMTAEEYTSLCREAQNAFRMVAKTQSVSVPVIDSLCAALSSESLQRSGW